MMPLNTIENFWSKVDIRGPNDCWPWKASLLKTSGYGQFPYKGKPRLAHRVALFGLIQESVKELALHTCDNPPCCNPKHLFPGTHLDNARDAAIKGRLDGNNLGIKNGHARFTENDIKTIRRLYKNGVNYSSIANHYNCHYNAIRHIVKRDTWKHIPEDE